MNSGVTKVTVAVLKSPLKRHMALKTGGCRATADVFGSLWLHPPIGLRCRVFQQPRRTFALSGPEVPRQEGRCEIIAFFLVGGVASEASQSPREM